MSRYLGQRKTTILKKHRKVEPPEDNHLETLKLINDVVRDKLKNQADTWNTLRTKTWILFAATAVVFPRLIDLGESLSNVWGYLAYCAMILALAVTYSLSLRFLIFQGTRDDPDPKPFSEKYWNKPTDIVGHQVLTQYNASFVFNKKVLERNTKTFNLGVRAFVLAVLLYFALELFVLGSIWLKRTEAEPTSQPVSSEVSVDSLDVFQRMHPDSLSKGQIYPGNNGDGMTDRDKSSTDKKPEKKAPTPRPNSTEDESLRLRKEESRKPRPRHEEDRDLENVLNKGIGDVPLDDGETSSGFGQYIRKTIPNSTRTVK